MKDAIVFESLFNFRDEGGFETSYNGMRVREGWLYRSGRLECGTHSDCVRVSRLVPIIIDLRSIDERPLLAHRTLEYTRALKKLSADEAELIRRRGCEPLLPSPIRDYYEDIPIATKSLSKKNIINSWTVDDCDHIINRDSNRNVFYSLPFSRYMALTVLHATPLWRIVLAFLLSLFCLKGHAARVMAAVANSFTIADMMNEAMIDRGGQAICWILRAVTVNTRPILIHCSMGKDRTGVVLALIHSVLGVSQVDIVADYVRSGSFLSEPILRSVFPPEAGAAKYWQESPPSAIKDTLTYIVNKYGSINGYLDTIGFDLQWRKRLRYRLLNIDHNPSITNASSPLLNDL